MLAQAVERRPNRLIEHVDPLTERQPYRSTGFNSGLLGGSGSSTTFSGTTTPRATWAGALSSATTLRLSGYAAESFERYTEKHAASRAGISQKCPSPVAGSTAPYSQ